MLFLFSFVSVVYEFKQQPFRKRIESKHNTKSLKSTSEGWYLVNLPFDISIDDLSEHGIKVETRHMITKHSFSKYLNQEQVSYLNQIAELRLVDGKEKIIKNGRLVEKTNYFTIEVDESFTPFFTHYKQITKYIYQLYTKTPKSMVQKLINNPKVFSITPTSPIEFKNRWGSQFLQSGRINLTYNENNRYYNKRGINGSGVIVSVTDSGLDSYNGYFYDKNMNISYDKVMPEHRKIYYYNNYIDDWDSDNDGHGTHVCGTIAGKADCENCPASLYNGVAPEAKIALFDVGNISEARRLDLLSVHRIARDMEKIGSYISSNSWGSEHEEVTVAGYDDISWGFEEAIYIFAAGNEGEYGNWTVGSPGDAKNVLTIGALKAPYPYTFEKTRKYNNTISFILNDNVEAILVNYSFNPYRDLNPKIKYENIKVIPKTEDVCNISNAENYDAIIVQKIENCTGKTYPIPIFYVDSVDKLEVEVLNIKPNTWPNETQYEMAYWSSRGPTIRGAIKPDVVAPGVSICSAKTIPHDTKINHSIDPLELNEFSGTSMATPMASGATALIYQYLSLHDIKPDSSLLKAMIVASADPLPGCTFTPNINSGHGSINLRNILPMEEDKFSIGYLIGDKIALHGHRVIKITVSDTTQPLRIAMAYLDQTLSADTIITLAVDLDLAVEDPDGKIYNGNHRDNKLEEHFSTIEKVTIKPEELKKGEYKIHVYCEGYVPTKAIKYSLAVSGQIVTKSNLKIEQLAAQDPTECPKICDGKCNSQYTCQCDDHHVGHQCQLPITIHTATNSKHEYSLTPLDMKYLKLTLPDEFDNITMSFSKPQNAPAFYMIFSCLFNSSFTTFVESDMISNILFSSNTVVLDYANTKHKISNQSLWCAAMNHGLNDLSLTIDYAINAKHNLDTTGNEDTEKPGNLVFILFLVFSITGYIIAVVLGIILFKVKRSRKPAVNIVQAESADMLEPLNI